MMLSTMQNPRCDSSFYRTRHALFLFLVLVLILPALSLSSDSSLCQNLHSTESHHHTSSCPSELQRQHRSGSSSGFVRHRDAVHLQKRLTPEFFKIGMPSPLRDWRIFQDDFPVRRYMREGYGKALHLYDKLIPPYPIYRHYQVKWRYYPDLRKHYFFPRVLRVPAVWQETAVPHGEAFNNHIQGDEKHIGLAKLVDIVLPDFSAKFQGHTKSIPDEDLKEAASRAAAAVNTRTNLAANNEATTITANALSGSPPRPKTFQREPSFASFVNHGQRASTGSISDASPAAVPEEDAVLAPVATRGTDTNGGPAHNLQTPEDRDGEKSLLVNGESANLNGMNDASPSEGLETTEIAPASPSPGHSTPNLDSPGLESKTSEIPHRDEDVTTAAPSVQGDQESEKSEAEKLAYQHMIKSGITFEQAQQYHERLDRFEHMFDGLRHLREAQIAKAAMRYPKHPGFDDYPPMWQTPALITSSQPAARLANPQENSLRWEQDLANLDIPSSQHFPIASETSTPVESVPNLGFISVPNSPPRSITNSPSRSITNSPPRSITNSPSRSIPDPLPDSAPGSPLRSIPNSPLRSVPDSTFLSLPSQPFESVPNSPLSSRLGSSLGSSGRSTSASTFYSAAGSTINSEAWHDALESMMQSNVDGKDEAYPAELVDVVRQLHEKKKSLAILNDHSVENARRRATEVWRLKTNLEAELGPRLEELQRHRRLNALMDLDESHPGSTGAAEHEGDDTLEESKALDLSQSGRLSLSDEEVGTNRIAWEPNERDAPDWAKDLRVESMSSARGLMPVTSMRRPETPPHKDLAWWHDIVMPSPDRWSNHEAGTPRELSELTDTDIDGQLSSGRRDSFHDIQPGMDRGPTSTNQIPRYDSDSDSLFQQSPSGERSPNSFPDARKGFPSASSGQYALLKPGIELYKVRDGPESVPESLPNVRATAQYYGSPWNKAGSEPLDRGTSRRKFRKKTRKQFQKNRMDSETEDGARTITESEDVRTEDPRTSSEQEHFISPESTSRVREGTEESQKQTNAEADLEAKDEVSDDPNEKEKGFAIPARQSRLASERPQAELSVPSRGSFSGFQGVRGGLELPTPRLLQANPELARSPQVMRGDPPGPRADDRRGIDTSLLARVRARTRLAPGSSQIDNPAAGPTDGQAQSEVSRELEQQTGRSGLKDALGKMRRRFNFGGLSRLMGVLRGKGRDSQPSKQ